MKVLIEELPKNAVDVKLIITPDSYQNEFKKQVNSYAKKAVLPGFRPGTVPPDLIKAKYGQSLLYDIVNKKVSDEIQKIIKEKNYELIAKPLLKNSDLKNLKPNEEFTFHFQFALFPKIELDLSKIPPIPDFEIQITDQDVEDQLQYLQKEQGKITEVLEITNLEELYKIQGKLIEVDDNDVPVTNGYQTELILYSDTEKIRPYLHNGLRTGDEIKIPLSQYFDSQKDASIVLKIPQNKINELYQKNFLFKILHLWKVEPLDRQTELFPKILKNPNITYEQGMEEFKKLFQRDLQEMSQNHKKNFIEKQLLQNFDFEIYDEIVAYSLMADYEFKTLEELQHHFPNYLTKTKLEILKQKLFKEHPELSVSVKDVAQKVEKDFSSLFQNTPPNPPQTETSQEVQELNPISEVEQDTTQKYIQSLTKQVMQDKNFVNRKRMEMENANLIRFFEEKTGKNTQPITVKEFFETINSFE